MSPLLMTVITKTGTTTTTGWALHTQSGKDSHVNTQNLTKVKGVCSIRVYEPQNAITKHIKVRAPYTDIASMKCYCQIWAD